MADDQKLEVLEEEIKVLKGEVRRTLVDLRALVMRADSPLGDSSIGRRAAMADLAPEEETAATRKESSETVRQVVAEPVAPVPTQPPPVAQPAPEAVAQPGPGPAVGFAPPGPPSGMPPEMPIQPAPMWSTAPMYQPPLPAPAPAPAPGPSPGAPDSGAAEQMLKMADQERRLAEQDRKMAEQERNMAEADRSKSDDKQQPSDKQSEQEQRIAKLELNLAEARKPPEMGPSPGPGGMPVKKDDPMEEAEEEDEKFNGSLEELGIPIQDPGDPEDRPTEDHAEGDVPGTVSNNGHDSKYEDHENEQEEIPKKVTAEVRNVERQEPVQQLRQEPEDESPETNIGSQFNHVEEECEPRGNKGRGSPVFDEYLELMEIAEGPELPGLVPAGAPLDLNLVASLVRWASIAKHRVGEERLSGILELYFQSRPISPSLKDLLNQITEMADALPGDEEQTAQVCVDLISHLHGILTGGLPVGQVSQVVLPTKG